MCYEQIDSWDKYNESSLPPKEKFFSKRKIRAILDGDCKHVQTESIPCE